MWYKEQKAEMNSTNHARYSSVYPFALDDAQGITATSALFDPSGTFVGVAGVDLELTFLSDMIRKAMVGKSTVSYIVEKNGLLIAASHGAAGAPNARLHATNSTNTLIQDSAMRLGLLSGVNYFTFDDDWVDVSPL